MQPVNTHSNAVVRAGCRHSRGRPHRHHCAGGGLWLLPCHTMLVIALIKAIFPCCFPAGIREGGRTGITALVVAFGFFISLFFTPLIASIPPFATGPALVLVRLLLPAAVWSLPVLPCSCKVVAARASSCSSAQQAGRTLVLHAAVAAAACVAAVLLSTGGLGRAHVLW